MTDDLEQQRQEPDNPIIGEVLAILSNREVLLSVGKPPWGRAALGMRFAVLGSVDVDTHDGRTFPVDYAKTVVKIVRFQGDELSVGRTFRTIPGRKGRPPMSPGSLTSMAMPWDGTPDIPARTETINTGGEDTALKGRDTVVRPGDAVRQITGDEFLETL